MNLRKGVDTLKALSVDNGGSSLIVLLFTDPHLLKSREGGQDRTANPHRVLPLWGSDDLRERVKC